MKAKYFKGKNAVITGAASGIGRELALQLAEIGTNLVISDINMVRLEEVREKAEKFGVKVVAMKCDVTSESEVLAMAENAVSEMKDIHFLFSNAGIAAGGLFEELTNEAWERIIKINIWGMVYVVRAFIRKFLEQGFGHVIITASIAGSFAIGGLTPYSTSKFANAGFGEALYGEYKSRGINVSIVCPFPLNTNLIETVSVGFPDGLFVGMGEEDKEKAIEAGKKYYWSEFVKKQSITKGFGGGVPVEQAVKSYLKQIGKKKLYIYERRYGRLLQFLKGFMQGPYKSLLKTFGTRNSKVIQQSIKVAVNSLDPEKIEEIRAAGNKYVDLYMD